MTIPASLIPLALTAIRVPPIQFVLGAGLPEKLVNTDLMTGGCGVPVLPTTMTSILALISAGTAFTINSTMTAITASISGVLGTLATFIGETTGGLQADLTALQTALTTGDILTLAQGISGVATSVANAAGVVTSMSALASSLSLPALPSLDSIFGAVAGGSLNTAVAGVSTATTSIVSTLNAAIGNPLSLTGLVAPLTAAFASAVSASIATVGTAVTDLTSSISSALTNLASGISSAGALASSLLCPEMAAFKTFIDTIATPALRAVLPT